MMRCDVMCCGVMCCAVLCCAVLLQEPIKPHEVKVLNYLAHEYLLQRGNTMTAITLCEENSDQACGQSSSWGRAAACSSHFGFSSHPLPFL